jgi:hypothetical protein
MSVNINDRWIGRDTEVEAVRKVMADAETHLTVTEKTDLDRPAARDAYPMLAELFALQPAADPANPKGERFIAAGAEVHIDRVRQDLAIITVPVTIGLRGEALYEFLAAMNGLAR